MPNNDFIGTRQALVAIRSNPLILFDFIRKDDALKHQQFSLLLSEAVNKEATLMSADDKKYWLDFNLLYLLLAEKLTEIVRDQINAHIDLMESDKRNCLAPSNSAPHSYFELSLKMDSLWMTLISIKTLSHDVRIRMLYVMSDVVSRNKMIKKFPELSVQK